MTETVLAPRPPVAVGGRRCPPRRLAGAVTLAGDETVSGPWELAVEHGVISRLRPVNDAAPTGDAAPRDEGEGEEALVLLPLLTNGHDHGRGRGTIAEGHPDAPLEEWLAGLAPTGDPTAQERWIGAAAQALLRSGIGAVVWCVNLHHPDVEAEVRAACRATRQAGLRAAVVYPIVDGPQSIEQRLADIDRVAADEEGPTLEIQLGPVNPQWVSPDALKAVAKHSASTGRRVHMHLLESRAQRTWADGAHPDGLLTFLDDIGLLTDRCWLAHGTQLRPDELDLLARRGCGLTLNASSNLRLASGIPPVAAAVASVGRTAMGLDGLALGDDQDGWTELRLLRGLWQAQIGRKVAARAVLELACHPARAAVGRAAPQLPRSGIPADFVLCDIGPWRHLLGRPDWPVEEIIVGAMSPDRVREVWVHGTCVWRDTP